MFLQVPWEGLRACVCYDECRMQNDNDEVRTCKFSDGLY